MIKSAYRVCQILKLVAKNNDGLKHSEIRKTLNIPTSSLSGLLNTLVGQRFVYFDLESQKYFLGPEIFSLSSNYLHNIDISYKSKPVLHKLAVETGESVAIAIRVGYEILIIGKEDSPKPIIPTVPLGQRVPAYATSVGRVFLAYLSNFELEQYFTSVDVISLTSKTITDLQLLRKELRKVRSSGIAVNEGEFHAEVFALAAPIFDFNENVIGALSVSLPMMRLNTKKKKLFSKSLKNSADTLSRMLGHYPQR